MREPAAHPSARPSTGFRPDIEGLRGIAIAAVLLYHAFGAPVGGFTGVDVFFVLSGYLITGILLRERARTGSISIVDFYARRARRILPAAAVVLVVTTAAAWTVWYAPRAWSATLDALASAAFVENWRLVAQGNDYLNASGAVSPLQHFWSLAVEEQFYALWPIAVIAVTSRFAGRVFGKAGLVTVTILVIASSVAWAVFRSTTAPEASYFDSIGRVWELAAGALLAISGPLLSKCPRRVAGIVFVLGLALIVASTVTIDGGTAFPWPFAVLPVVGALLVIGTGDRAGKAALVLTNRPVRWLGRVSYSLYLWHFPLIVFVQSVTGDSPLVMASTVLVALVLAGLSERFIERPAMRPRTRRGRHSRPRQRLRSASGAVLAAAVAVGLCVATVSQFRGPAEVRDPDAASALSSGSADAGKGEPFTPEALRRDILSAATDTAWASGDRGLLNGATSRSLAPAMLADGCRNDVSDRTAPRTCEWGPRDAGRTAVIVGDSIALSWTPTVVAALGSGWHVTAVGYASCSYVPIDMPATLGRNDFGARCEASRARMTEVVDAIHPDLVITSSADYLAQLVPAAGTDALTTWERATTAMLRSIEATGARAVLLEGTPSVVSPASCATRLTGPASCTGSVDASFHSKAAADARAVEAAGLGSAVTHVRTLDWLCTSDGRCPTIVDGTLVRADHGHLTDVMARRLGPLLAERL